MSEMYLVEILLPLRDKAGQPFPVEKFTEVRRTLVATFGGMTAFTRAPAEGVFEAQGGVVRDDIVVFEVMADTLAQAPWQRFRKHLEREFGQDEIVIRACAMRRL